MKKILCLIAFMAVLSTTSFSQKKFKDAIDFNDYLVSANDTLYYLGQAWGRQFVEARSSHNWDELTRYRLDLENFIQKKRDEYKKLAPYKGSEELVATALDFLKMESQMSWKAFAPFEAFDKNTTDAEFKTAADNLSALAKAEAEKLQEFRDAQDRYAAKNGFRIAKDE